MTFLNPKKITILVVTFFGVGHLKPAPGTWATLATIPVVWLLVKLGTLPYMFITLLICLIGLIYAQYYEQLTQIHDQPHVVIDEVAGFLITMTWLPMTWQAFLLGFILFRALDIFKPLFIGALDQKVKGGLGVMADDIAAGIVANLILQIIYSTTPWLGEQLLF